MREEWLERLAKARGIGDSYHDYRGELKQFPLASKAALLAAMGIDTTSDESLRRASEDFVAKPYARLLPPVVVCEEGELSAHVYVPMSHSDRPLRWRVDCANGAAFAGEVYPLSLREESRSVQQGETFVQLTLPLPDTLGLGYHALQVSLGDVREGRARLIVCPSRCYAPAAIERNERVWGIAVQLYTVRTPENWGIGDFRDLRALINIAAPLGCGIIGLNPLHALFPAQPEHSSPYSPSNRQFLNVLYITVEDVPEFTECEALRERVGSPAFKSKLADLRALPAVDYAAVAKLKFDALREIYDHFRAQHLAHHTMRAREFREFVERGGEPLRLHAIYDALDRMLRARDSRYGGWISWPEEFRDASSLGVQRFAAEHDADVEYFLYLQWNAHTQLATAQRRARDLGMQIGLYGDVAVGANPGGSETWSNRRLYLIDAAIGAPPDPLALKGQDWGIPPQDPVELAAQGYMPFRTLLENNMIAVAALRLDHVMSLYRLWWVPKGATANDGAYVHYPLSDLAGILALESHRHRCLVIGEDLGTVPDEVREEMGAKRIYHYKVLLFEKEHDGRFKAPAAYEPLSLATVTTHDLPTLRGWWEGYDLALRDQLNLYPNAAIREETRTGRAHDSRALMRALVDTGLWHWTPAQPLPEYSMPLVRAIHCYLAMSAANVALVQVEDLIGMTDPVNVPGTHTEHPNWQRKVTADLSDIFTRPEVIEMLSAVNKARKGENPNR
jgi:4-alpha-glucanotransferase